MDLTKEEVTAAPPARASAYIPPTDVPRESKYHTIDMQAVRLSPEIDPRRMKTQIAMRRVEVPRRPNYPRAIGLGLAGVAVGIALWWTMQWRHERRLAEESSGLEAAALVQARTPSPVVAQSTPPGPVPGAPTAMNAPSDVSGSGRSTVVSTSAPPSAEQGSNSRAPQPDPGLGTSASAVAGLAAAPASTLPLGSGPPRPKPMPKAAKSRATPQPSAESSAPPSDSKVWVTPSEPKVWLK